MKKIITFVMALSLICAGSLYAGGSGGGGDGAGGNATATATATGTGGAGGAGGAGGEGGNAFATGGMGIGIGGSSSAKVGDISNSASGGAVVGSGNSAVGNGIGNFSPSAKVGDVSATGGKATIEKGAIDNKNTNTNMNIVAPVQSTKVENTNVDINVVKNKNDVKVDNKVKVDNTNVNVSASDQDQKQKQKQNQNQKQSQNATSDQSQSQSANNTGVSQTNNYESDKRDLLEGPPVPMVDPKLTAAKAGAMKTKGSLWDHMTRVYAKNIDKILDGKSSSKSVVEIAAVDEKDFRTDEIALETAKPKKGDYLATIYVYSDGANMQQLQAIAIKEAMKLGGTHIVLGTTDFKVQADGSAWGVGLGGGASMFVKGDDIGIAPSGGMGFSGAKASNESLPQAMFTVYCDMSLIITGSMKN